MELQLLQSSLTILQLCKKDQFSSRGYQRMSITIGVYLMADPLKLAMVALNVYHFFIRKGALMPCLNNILNPQPGILTKDQARNTLEILIIGYMCGILLMPGGNWQF